MSPAILPAMPLFRLLSLTALLAALTLTGSPALASEDDLPDHRDGEICVRLTPDADIATISAEWGTTLVASLDESNHHLLRLPEGMSWEEFAPLAAGDLEVELAERNWVIEGPEAVRQMVIGAVGGTWSDVEFQRMAETIGLAEAHAVSQGEGIVVAVLDTGLEESHEAFDDRLSDYGLDLVDGDHHPDDEANEIDDDLDGLVDEGFGHGTMVAGLIALVAPHAEILPIRILDDEGRTDLFTMAAGIELAISLGADVINMSFGARLEALPGLHYLFEQCAELGVIPVAGAGNENLHEPPLYPARLDEVFMVTALDSLGVKADFADYHEGVLVSAPGVGLRSAHPEIEVEEGEELEWGLGDGCSFATALVSAEVALILALEPTLTHAEVQARVAGAVVDIDHLPGNEAYAGMLGSGRIYLPYAVDGIQTAVPTTLTTGGIALDAYPNPSRAAVRFALPGAATAVDATMSIFDVSGRRVRRLKPVGDGAWLWDGLDARGRKLPAGSYFARLATPTGPAAAQVLLLR